MNANDEIDVGGPTLHRLTIEDGLRRLPGAAGTAHRFENFTDDLAVWVLFYGPEGGEVE